MTNHILFGSPNETGDETLRLAKAISAIELVSRQDGGSALGLLSRLPPGVTVHRCGRGFDERTAKVRLNNQCFIVFRQDLEAAADQESLAS